MGRSVTDQRDQSRQLILEKASMIRREIQYNVNLTDQDKQFILTGIDRWLQNHYAAINHGNTADEIVRQQQYAIQQMQNLYQDNRFWHTWLSRQRFISLPDTGRTAELRWTSLFQFVNYFLISIG